MMPPAKKRKEPPPNHTLLDFFSGPDATKRARAKASQQSAPSVRPTNLRVASREIIVIDSDSDDDDVRRQENDKRGVRVNPKTVDCDDSQSLDSVSPIPAHSEDKDSFGAPSELLQPINPRMEESSSRFYTDQYFLSASKSDHTESMFGVSAPLLEETSVREQATERSQSGLTAYESIPTSPGDSSSNFDAPVRLPIGEWTTGDDEFVLQDLDNAETHESEGAPSDEQHFCPVCSKDLTGILVCEAQTHANQCLDGTLQNDDLVMQGRTGTAVSIEPFVTSDNSGPISLVKGQGGDLYAVLMNSYKDNQIRVDAEDAAEHDFGPTWGNRRRAPFYKVLQGMPIAVDAFCYGAIPGVTAYFLTHAHSDHYTNLGSKWKNGPIYCTEETANLITQMLAVDPRWIRPLPLDTPTVIADTGGVSVTLIEANHCPGSCLFFFEGQQTIDAGDSAIKSPFIGSSRIFHYLHCGDFRASPRHVLHPTVKGKHIDHIYLDTTYLDPKYAFPPQSHVTSACAELARRLVVGGVGDNSSALTSCNSTIDAWTKPSISTETRGQQTVQERTLVIVGTYSIGKERIVKAIAQALRTKIYCDPRKTAILRCQTDQELHALLTADPTEANVHILPLGTLTSDNLKSYLQRFKGTFSRVIGFRPTGWTYSSPSGNVDIDASIQSIISRGQSRRFAYTDLQPSQKSSYSVQIFGVPYSEHSSFFELTCFAMSCDWGRIIPTVNMGSPTSRAKVTKWLKRWELERKCNGPSVIKPRTIDYW